MKYITLAICTFFLGVFISGNFIFNAAEDNKFSENTLLMEDLALQLQKTNNLVKENKTLIESFSTQLSYSSNQTPNSLDTNNLTSSQFNNTQISEIKNIIDEYSNFQNKYLDQSLDNLEINLNRSIGDISSQQHVKDSQNTVEFVDPTTVTEEQVVRLDKFLDDVEYVDIFSAEENGLPEYLEKVVSAGLHPMQLEEINEKLREMSREHQL